MERKIYFIGGTSGTGKSSLIKSAIENETEGTTVVSTGDLFNSVISKQFNIGLSRDELKRTNWRLFEPYVISGLGAIIEYYQGIKLLVDSHYAVNSPSGFVQGLSTESLEYIGWHISARGFERCKCILVTSPTEETYKRIIKDTTRNRRDGLSQEALEEERRMNEQLIMNYKGIFSKYVPTEIVEIENIDINKSSDELKEQLK